jgi:hypothetical protein
VAVGVAGWVGREISQGLLGRPTRRSPTPKASASPASAAELQAPRRQPFRSRALRLLRAGARSAPPGGALDHPDRGCRAVGRQPRSAAADALVRPYPVFTDAVRDTHVRSMSRAWRIVSHSLARLSIPSTPLGARSMLIRQPASADRSARQVQRCHPGLCAGGGRSPPASPGSRSPRFRVSTIRPQRTDCRLVASLLVPAAGVAGGRHVRRPPSR